MLNNMHSVLNHQHAIA